MISKAQKEELIKQAKAVVRFSYAPYSGFRVGAALLCVDGSIFTGTNIENRSYGLTICAERNALSAAVSAGKRDFTHLAIYSPDREEPLPPCGACRQVISEFAKKNLIIIMAGSKTLVSKSISSLLPMDALYELKKHS